MAEARRRHRLEISRGDVVISSSPGDYGKPRPAVVVQSDLFNPTHPYVVATGDTLEDVILRYEEPVTQISGAADRVAQFDKGIEPVVMELVTYIEALREQSSQSQRDLTDTRQRVAELDGDLPGHVAGDEVVLGQSHVRAVLFRSARGNNDSGLTRGDGVANLVPGQFLQ